MGQAEAPTGVKSGGDEKTLVRGKPKAVAAFAHLAQMHLDETANLWSMWVSALGLPQYDRHSLIELERRIQAHIAGMRLHEQAAWQRCVEDLDIADAAETFAAAQLAFRSYEVEKIKTVVQLATDETHRHLGMITALAWLPVDIGDPWINKFLKSKQPIHKYFAVEACRWRGEIQQEAVLTLLAREDCRTCEPLKNALLRSAADFKLTAARPIIETWEASYWQQYCLLMLGDPGQAMGLRQALTDPCDQISDSALHTVFRSLDRETAQRWVRELAETEATTRLAILGACILGEGQVLPWLIGLMHKTEHARYAGFAFAVITGCDLEANDYVLAEPPRANSTTEAEDSEPLTAFEASLPWPNADLLWQVWQQHLQSQFEPEVRYLMGRPLSQPFCQSLIEGGNQFVRRCAAYELALNNPQIGLYNACGIQSPES